MKNKKGFFAIGMEGISKDQNAGAIFRTAHAFGADLTFAVNPNMNIRKMYRADTSKTFSKIPFYQYDSPSEIQVPDNCAIVGVELCENSIILPEFCHPTRAAYVMGPERRSLSPEMQERCDYVVKIPTQFCLNVSVAAAIVIYDRISSVHKWHRRPLVPWGNPELRPKHVSGGAIIRTRKQKGYDI